MFHFSPSTICHSFFHPFIHVPPSWHCLYLPCFWVSNLLLLALIESCLEQKGVWHPLSFIIIFDVFSCVCLHLFKACSYCTLWWSVFFLSLCFISFLFDFYSLIDHSLNLSLKQLLANHGLETVARQAGLSSFLFLCMMKLCALISSKSNNNTLWSLDGDVFLNLSKTILIVLQSFNSP